MLFPQPICCLYPDVCVALLLSVVRKNAVCVAFLRYTKQSPQSFYESIIPVMSLCVVLFALLSAIPDSEELIDHWHYNFF